MIQCSHSKYFHHFASWCSIVFHPKKENLFRIFLVCHSCTILTNECNTRSHKFYVYSHSNFKSKTDLNNNRTSHTTYMSNKPTEKKKKKKIFNHKLTTATLLHLIIFGSHPYLTWAISFVVVLLPFIHLIFFRLRWLSVNVPFSKAVVIIYVLFYVAVLLPFVFWLHTRRIFGFGMWIHFILQREWVKIANTV